MKFTSLVCIAGICIALASCGQSKNKDKSADTVAEQTLTSNIPSDTQVDPNQPFFSNQEYMDVVVKLREVGCNIDRTTGVTSCPSPSSLEEADSLYVLLAKFEEGLYKNEPSITEPVLRAILEKSVAAEILKITESTYIKPLQIDIKNQLGQFKVECMFGFDKTLGFQNRLAGIPLMRDLCADSGFMSEIARLKVGVSYGGLVVSERNKFSLVTTWTRLRIGFNSSKTDVLEFIAKQTL